MASPFQIYRILGSTTPDMESEREIFESSLTKFGEAVTFPQQILFAGASFPGGFDPNRHRAPAEANVRMCDFCLYIFGEDWQGPAFRDLIRLAINCAADPAMPMRKVAVLFRNSSGADAQVRQLRETLLQEGKCDIRDFQDQAELPQQLEAIYAIWYASVTAPAAEPDRSSSVSSSGS
jgi:hypothetical protein